MTTGSFRVRVVGSSSSIPRPGRACSCYLLRTETTNVALDFGTGALAKLREALDYAALDAVVITHMHADHFLDLIPLRYAIKYGESKRADRMPLWLPPNGERRLRALCGPFSRDETKDFLDGTFDIREYDPTQPLPIGDLTLTFAATEHYIEAYAIRAACNGASIVYSADTAPSQFVERLAKDCDLFICESTLGLATEEGPERGHLNASEAGALAAAAGAKRLVLTHYGTEYTPNDLQVAASASFSRPCTVADDGMEIAAQ